MENGALYVALAILVIIITVMIWNRNVDTYSRIGGCQVQCQTLSGTARSQCIQECLGNQIIRYGGQQCSSDNDCQTEQVCVMGGFYTGEEGRVFPISNIGTCMDENDPGTVEWRQKSVFHKPPLPPHDRPASPPSFSSKLGKAAQHLHGKISPSKVENYKFKSCSPGQYWDAYVNEGQGGCKKIFSGKSSAWYVNNEKPDEPTEVSIPGTTLPGYGVGTKVPKDIPSGVFISTDPGYDSRKM